MAKSVKAKKPKEARGGRAPSMVGGIKRADFVSALARGLDVLRLFSESRPRLSTSDVAVLTGLSRAAARRFLLTLTELGYLHSEGDLFEPRPKILELGYTYLSTWRFPELVRPYLQDVVDALQENCSFAVLDGSDVVYLARAEARRIVQSITVSVGTRIPAGLSSLGRVLLAYQPAERIDTFLEQHPLRAATPMTITDPVLFRKRLAAIREQGWTLINGEFEEELISIAVPVLSPDGVPVGAINVGAPTSRATAAQMEAHYLPVLKEAADNIARAFAASGLDLSRIQTVRIASEIP
ncbi:Pca regulon regulatory protein [Ensifer psoraleae]|uniref:IclR family transcriptional regulator domain-containing protein n=1 Tax=Sinorhizobium psoraleae TaxID=520838 RepID=UPI001AEECA4D|nr:IclR family transcriptional regulator C-terminal domain-containing protein [Sinorhizobium psoraleae]NRP72149.1 Pca regulon regulatory protein [Sinorhizobium psoraleae]